MEDFKVKTTANADEIEAKPLCIKRKGETLHITAKNKFIGKFSCTSSREAQRAQELLETIFAELTRH